jgi:hypothetical protein
MPAVARLLARLEAPLLTDLVLTGTALLNHAPAALPDVHAGAPVLIGLRLRPEGGELQIAGQFGGRPWEEAVSVPAMVAGEGNPAVLACYGREAVEDLEMLIAAGERDFDEQIETLGLDFQIATRLTSWVAVTEEATVDPLQPLRRERIPQELPAGLSAAGLGLRGRQKAPRLSLRMDTGAGFGGQTLARLLSFELEQAVMSARRPKRHDGLRGRIVLRRDGELVVEITVDKLLAWEPSNVRLVWRDNTECGAEIDATQSTRPGAVKGGTVIRLVLRLDDSALPGPPARILLVSRSHSLDITLEP